MATHHEQPKDVMDRLSRIEGHVRAVQRMAQDQASCEDLLLQISAVKSALDKTGQLILENHLENCIVEGVESGNADETMEKFKSALLRYIGNGRG